MSRRQGMAHVVLVYAIIRPTFFAALIGDLTRVESLFGRDAPLPTAHVAPTSIGDEGGCSLSLTPVAAAVLEQPSDREFSSYRSILVTLLALGADCSPRRCSQHTVNSTINGTPSSPTAPMALGDTRRTGHQPPCSSSMLPSVQFIPTPTTPLPLR